MQNYVEQTETYLSQHHLRENLEKCVNDLLRTRPRDPYTVLAKEIRKFAVCDVIFVLGPPGSHKEELSDRLSSEFGCCHLSLTRILEQERKRESDRGELINTCIRDKRDVPSDLIVQLMEEAAETQRKQGQSLIIMSNFSYSMEVDEHWNKFAYGKYQMKWFLNIDTPKQVCERRLLEDEDAATATRLMEDWNKHTMPVVRHYTAQRVSTTISGMGQVYEELRSLFGTEFDNQTSMTACVLLKPDVVSVGSVTPVIELIKAEGFEIVEQVFMTLSEEQAEVLHEDLRDTPRFREVVGLVCSDTSCVLVVRRVNVFRVLRTLAGPDDPMEAQRWAPDSIRAIYGTDSTQNAIHISSGVVQAEQELAVLLPHKSFHEEVTLALIKPDVTEREGVLKEVLKYIKKNGFRVVAQKSVVMTKEEVERLYGAGHNNSKHDSKVLAYMIGGTTVAVAIAKVNAVRAWSTLLGGADEAARGENPHTLRGQYASSEIKDSFHGSVHIDAANRELEMFFPESPSLNKLGPKCVLHGPPGAGKSTQSEILCHQFGTVQLNMKHMIQDVIKIREKLGIDLDKLMRNGRSIPDHMLMGVVNHFISQPQIQRRGWMLIGFPTTTLQASLLAKNHVNITHFINIEIKNYLCAERLETRKVDPETHKVYNTKAEHNRMPTEETIKERLISLPDDTAEAVAQRLQQHEHNITSLKDRYWHALVTVDGNSDVEQVYHQLVSNLWAISM